jgi:predicted dehydrogenase
MSNASHELDLINWLIGAPKEVSAFVGNQLHDIEVEDSVCASVMFANGAYGSLQFTANQPPAYSVRQVAGQNGIIVLPNVQSLYTDPFRRQTGPISHNLGVALLEASETRRTRT